MMTVSTAQRPAAIAQAAELLTCYGSPLYVYEMEPLRATLHHITHSITYPRTRFCFASVTNGNVALLRQVRKVGWGLHANTPGDIYLGLQAGFAPEQIVYSGSNLSRLDMEQVLRWGVRQLNLDSLSQVQQFCELVRNLEPPLPALDAIALGLRLNCPDLTGDSRIGVRPSEFADAVRLAGEAGWPITGLHFYRGTGTNATEAFTQVMDRLFAIAQQLPDWRVLDFGGGFGYPYRHGVAAFDWPAFGTALSQRLSQLPQPVDLILEPGRAAIAGCGLLLCRVVAVKWQGERQIVGTDTTVANLSVPSVHGGYRAIVCCDGSADRALATPRYPTDVCGNTTYSRDYLGRNCLLPPLQIGDILAVLDVGAYGYAMSSQFLHRPRPAEVLWDNGIHRLIRQRETYSSLLANQVLDNDERPEVSP